MAVVNRIAEFASDMTEWRQWMHRNPELGFDCHKTAAFVVERLKEFGITDIHTGIATTGVVAIIEGQGDGPTIGLRADMDALPLTEVTGADYTSETPGKMHACGHDGHTTKLLGAARYLAETRNFKGRVALIFQPAEENGGGGNVMVEEGMLETFDISEVYALHNAPGSEAGGFYTNPGAIMASVDDFHVTVQGVGGHGAFPHEAVDPIAAGVAMIQSLQSIVTRNNRPTDDLCLSITGFNAGTATNIIPAEAAFFGTVRAFSEDVRTMVETRFRDLVNGIAEAHGVTASIDYQKSYPATINDPDKASFAVDVAREIVGDDRVDANATREMGSEDFAYMLLKRPGAYLFLGQGDTPYCHHPAFDFNDDIAPIGASFFARLVERAQPV